ncbi:DUF7573 domain-containing protein [Halobacterium bonnevillei]|uniref:DUF7573 domain-containing protein n=1 Tax=Halobacterium bonnevillei TaxID=2692200 RepID=A0A6B0SYV9_9EURY|nr:hypothetical protein [Halobacterium bonnevillei]MXR22519.1 hypothetical protein [Halobacterium bonnevillei]
MTEEATLDAFVPDDGNAASDADATEGSGEGRDAASASPATATESPDSARDTGPDASGGAVERAAVTSSWLGDGGTCSACGEPAGRLWVDGGVRVCTTCKPWTRPGEDACDQ